MKIAEETGDNDVREQAKVNFGMANASMKWNNHVQNILQNINFKEEDKENTDNDHEDDDYTKLPDIKA